MLHFGLLLCVMNRLPNRDSHTNQNMKSTIWFSEMFWVHSFGVGLNYITPNLRKLYSINLHACSPKHIGCKKGNVHAGSPKHIGCKIGNLHAASPKHIGCKIGNLHAGSPKHIGCKIGNLHAGSPKHTGCKIGNLHAGSPKHIGCKIGNLHAGSQKHLLLLVSISWKFHECPFIRNSVMLSTNSDSENRKRNPVSKWLNRSSPNVPDCSLCHSQNILKISWKFTHPFYRGVANKHVRGA